MEDYKEQIKKLLSKPDDLLVQKPFYRGIDSDSNNQSSSQSVGFNEMVRVEIPDVKLKTISQSEYLKELDPNSHKVLFDDNVPSITMKLNGGGYQDIHFNKMALPLQQAIKSKQVLHLTGNPIEFTLLHNEPTAVQDLDFVTIKEYWDLRNQNGMFAKSVDTQKSVGNVGLLYYYNRKGEIKSRILSYPKYMICSHNDQNGDRLLECVYYKDSLGNERIDSYDDDYMYRMVKKESGNSGGNSGSTWTTEKPVAHGFPEIPLITKRGKVAWDEGQSIIETYEIQYNIFNVIMKRHGWGILYIKGAYNEKAQKIAGSILLVDKPSGFDNSQNDAKYLQAPTPEGMFDMLDSLMDQLQIAVSTTFILPKDIKSSGDISGIAVQLTQSGDNERALLSAIDWQNFIDKAVRLFVHGLASELVSKGIDKTAVTRFAELKLSGKVNVWMPRSEAELAQMLAVLVGAKITSIETASETIRLNKPSEKKRLLKEAEKAAELLKESKEETITVNKEEGSSNENINKENK